MAAIQQVLSSYLAGNLLLDRISGAVRAYSTRRIRTSYAGSSMRVRRSSDSTELDIGFVNDELDTAALATFVGAGDGFVKTFYDQSGAGQDATQATTASQPQIVLSGTLQTLNSKPVIYHNSRMLTFSNTGAIRTDWTVSWLFYTAQANAGSGGTNWYLMNGMVFSESGGVVNDFGLGNFGNKLTIGAGLTGGTDNAVQGATDLRSAVHIGTSTRVNSSGAVSLYLDGTLDGSGTLASGDRTSSTVTQIGGGNAFVGSIGEVIVFPSVLSSGDRSLMFTDQKTYWGVP